MNGIVLLTIIIVEISLFWKEKKITYTPEMLVLAVFDAAEPMKLQPLLETVVFVASFDVASSVKMVA